MPLEAYLIWQRASSVSAAKTGNTAILLFAPLLSILAHRLPILTPECGRMSRRDPHHLVLRFSPDSTRL